MRITLLDCDPEVVFGTGRHCPPRLRGLTLALARAGHEVSVLCAAYETASRTAVDGIVACELRLPASVREIDWHFSRVQPELVIERLVPGALEGARAAAEAGVPHLYDIDQPALPDALSASSAVRGGLAQALEHSTGALAASEAVAERARAAHGRGLAVEVVQAAAGEEFFDTPSADQRARVAQMLRVETRGGLAGFCGPLERDCGLLTLIGALARLPLERRPRLLVAGDGPERNPALRAAEQGRVALVLCGNVPANELPAHLALCDVVVVPGDDGGVAPRAMLEAMAMARAVIAPDTDAALAVARHDHDACLVPGGDASALAETVAALLADGRRRARLGAQARRTARAHHTWDARADRVLAFARSLAARSRAAEVPALAESARRAFSG